jgi:hypothetical protein
VSAASAGGPGPVLVAEDAFPLTDDVALRGISSGKLLELELEMGSGIPCLVIGEDEHSASSEILAS